jgi:hypothetical protein
MTTVDLDDATERSASQRSYFRYVIEQGLKSKEGSAQYSLAGSHLMGDERAL